MVNSLVSIIIPVYKVEPYLDKCVQSVIDQTYKNWEIILVDDGSPDRSSQMCDEWAQKDKRIRVIHQKNRGLSGARNTGIREAKGEWLYFLDSDDWIIPECIALMMQVVDEYPDVDMVMGNIKTIGKDYGWKFAEPGVYTEGFIEMSCSYKIYTMAWNKLLSKSFLVSNNLYFEEGLLHEDVLWFIQCACFLNRMVSIPQKTYNYNIRNGSIQTDKSFKMHYINMAMVKIKTIEFLFRHHFDENKILFRYIYDDLYDFLLKPMCKGENELTKIFYSNLRKIPFWSLSFIIRNKKTCRDFFLALNRYLPYNLGLPYIIFLNKFWGLKYKI